jgi:hypothetical protein
MTLLGVNAMLQFALPSGWDATELQRYALAEGTTYEAIVNDILAALEISNRDLMNDPLLGGMFSTTTEQGMEYRQGNTTVGMSERSEYTSADPRRGTTVGHMLPLRSFDRALGWTFDFLRKARRAQLDSDVAAAIYDVRDEFERRLLTRFFSDTDNQLGSSGYDVAFIKGGGSVAYVPPPFGGLTFTSSHSHFLRYATGSRVDAVKESAKTLWEHGIIGPYEAVVPFVDVTTWSGLSGFIKPSRGIDFFNVTTTGQAGVMTMDESYFGALETDFGVVRLRHTPRLPTNYMGVYKSYGNNDQRNPLKVRYSPDMGMGAILLAGDRVRRYPLEEAIIMHEYGIGVADRLNGVAVYFAGSGSYTAPTIS